MSGSKKATPTRTPEQKARMNEVLNEATAFLHQYDDETKRVPRGRLHDVVRSIRETGTYEATYDELVMAGKLAWRNSTRCNGRRFWRGLGLSDMRHLETEEEIFEACLNHIRKATNGGKLRPWLTVFKQKPEGGPGIRLWNSQLLRYAGYPQEDGSVLGDRMNLDQTRAAMKLGWKGKGTRFDLLPIVVQLPGKEPKWFEVPEEEVMTVRITHPDLDWFEDLGLQWYALPAITDMLMDAAGITYSAATFSGWYMDTEIGSRNFGDPERYDMLPVVAERMGLDTKSVRSLWKDRALLELNAAVLYSFKKAGATLVDHHTASVEFMRFVKQEEQLDRVAYGDWSWIVPPMSGAACPVFHREYVNEEVKPNFYYQPPGWTEFLEDE